MGPRPARPVRARGESPVPSGTTSDSERQSMRARRTAVLAAALTGLLATAAPAAADDGGSGVLELYSAPGLGHTVLQGGGCHTFPDKRMVTFADSEPAADYVFHPGPGCTGVPVDSGRDDSQWIPPLYGVRSVDVRFG